MAYMVISSSLNPDSKSRLLARAAFHTLQNMGASVQWLDLAERSLPLCDGDLVYEKTEVIELKDTIKQTEGILLAVPIYNFSGNAAAKNLIELTGNAWSNKVVGFLCAAGGKESYMSVMTLANSLMLDFRCLIIPRFVYATGDSFRGETVSDPQVKERVHELAHELNRICTALK